MTDQVTDEDLEQIYLADPRPGPWLVANMVTTIDGATAVDGRSSSLGDRQDGVVFKALRAVADIVLVAGSTVRSEGYQKPQLSERLEQWRVERGRSAAPGIAIVTRSLDFDIEPFGDMPPLILTSAASPESRRIELTRLTDVVVCGEDRVDLVRGLAALRACGSAIVLSEGGPSLNGQLASLDVVDEWCVTLAPLIVGGNSKRIVDGPDTSDPSRYRLDRALRGEDSLFTRWVRQRVSAEG